MNPGKKPKDDGSSKRQCAPHGHPASSREAALLGRGWGRTEKIRRRNRQLWSRLLGKERRRQDRDAIKEEA